VSGWQRLGIVVSVLWLVGAFIYLMAEWNRMARTTYELCYGMVVSNTSYKTEADRDQAKAFCLATLEEGSMAPTKLLHLLFTTHDENQNIAWIILLVPLAILWVLGATIIGTARWIRRGFQSSKA
jgi:hypothetical protein